MWILALNDMRAPKIETSEFVARADVAEKLHQWMRDERVEPYTEDNWRKVFKKGGPLEWYNEPFSGMGQGVMYFGTEEEWVQRALKNYHVALEGTHLVK
jgi:hypothetical protein